MPDPVTIYGSDSVQPGPDRVPIPVGDATNNAIRVVVVAGGGPGGGGTLTDTELRATPVPVSGVFFQATQPVSAVALPLPADAATASKQDTIIAALEAILADVDLLALIKAKTDNLDVPLSGGGAHVVVDAMPAVAAQSSALVDDAVPSYTAGTTQPLSMSPTGRLRVVTESEALNLSSWGEPENFQTRESMITGTHPLSAW